MVFSLHKSWLLHLVPEPQSASDKLWKHVLGMDDGTLWG